MKRKDFRLNFPVKFKKFQRKSYAIFNSLKQVVHIAVLPVACLTFAPTSNVLAQTSEMKSIEHNLQGVDVLGQKPSELTGRVSGVLFVIDRAEIAAAPVQSLQDLLEYVGSVDVRQRGGNGVQADVSIRGGSFDQVLILLNGVNITDPQTGHYSLDVPINLSDISRIEVLQGSGSRVLGATPFSGAINIITGEANKTEANVQVAAGDHGYVSQGASATVVSKSFTTFASASREQSDGYMANTDFDLINAYLQSVYSSEKIGKIQFQFGFQDKAYGANSFYSLAFPDQYEKTKTFFSSLGWDKKINKNNSVSVQSYWREHLDEFELFREGAGFYNRTSDNYYVNGTDTAKYMKGNYAPYNYYHGPNYHQTDVVGAAAKFVHLSTFGKSTVGVDFRDEHIFSNVLGNLMATTRQVPFQPSYAVFTDQKNRALASVFADQAVYFDKFSFAAGADLNHSNDFGTNFSGGADANYSISSQLSLYANVNQAFRLPTFTDLYYQSPIQVANPDLKPERSTVFESGLKYQNEGLRINSDVYYRIGKNVIDWVKMPDSTKWVSRNYTDVRALGADFSADYFFKNSFFKKIQVAYSFLHLNKDAGVYESMYALDYLKNKVNVGINHRVYKNISLNWNLMYQDRAGSYTDAMNNTVGYKPFFLADCRLEWSKNKVAIFADVNNIFDKQYADYGGLIQPGRWVRTGIRVKID
jgi:iron complex outermembrane receptor protein